ncbi:flagellar filament capping protein FliD [Pseudomonas sp. RTC3]|uniref:flagellar filament capping protein FliD n=1 Tax=Pseudomonas sp. 5C2 TaxID=3048588 RepID=UPI002AB3A046|nr:flagellar filament capping protein FliD [Pseudomonas sp. 5C2]MDY7563986.1 flagellar filament capping protein FliD [Pseudomonas sp. 5C2]MEB0060905.1 flagellar filament capping protein FliD [Pseudomonas sp. RTC3]MEB0241810.1 flagellar filament capping protein FliD [Pseudomonas sp. 5C2]
MASPIVPSTGLGSGLDIGSIVTALVNADKSAKQTQINSQTTLATSKISGVGSLKSALTAYQTALTNLGSATNPAFSGFAATSSTPATLGATSDNTAVNGSYNIVVQNLATSSKVATASFSGGATSAIPSGNLTITQNTTATSFTIPANSTLQSVRDLVNTQTATSGVSANIVTDSTGASRLVFGSTTTGAGSDITTTSSVAGLVIPANTALNSATPGSAGYIGSQALDANLTIDGLAVKSSSNTVSKAISGLSMTLVAAGSSTVTVATNTDGLKTSLQTFVDAYNTVVKTITSLTKATADSKGNLTVAAAMTGDSLPRTLLASLRDQLVTPGPGSQLSVLSQLGIQTDQKAGTLTFDSTKFTTAMTSKSLGGQVQQLFSGTTSTNGLLARMGAVLTPYTQTGGILDTRSSSLTTQKNALTTQQAALDLRVTNMTAALTAKYNAMDLLVGQMKATSTSITSYFTSLSASKTG